MGRSAVSLDLGSSGVRAALFTPGKTTAVQKLAYAPLPPGVITAGEVQDIEALTHALKALWQEHKFGTKHVHFSVGNNQVMVRPLDVDWLPPAEFRQALKYIAADHVPGDIDSVALDYHVLSEYEVPGDENTPPRRMCRIILVAAANAMIANFVTAIQGAGLLPVRANLESFSLIQATTDLTGDSPEAEAIVDVGAQVTTIIVHQGGQPRFVRIIPNQGGDLITNALVSRFAWSQADADATKMELGLNTRLAPVAPVESVFGIEQVVPSAPAEHPAHPIINQVASSLVAEVRQSVEYFLNSSEDVHTLRRVVLTGGASLLKGLAQRLASELRTNVEYGTPLQRVAVAKNVTLPPTTSEQQWAVAIGTALGGSR